MTIDDLYRRFRGFQVYTDSFYPKGLEAAKYIGRYLGHPPLATSHITQYTDPVRSVLGDGQRVQFWYRETATGLRRDVSLSPLEFISRLVPHPVQDRDGTGYPAQRNTPCPPRGSLCSQHPVLSRAEGSKQSGQKSQMQPSKPSASKCRSLT